MKIKKYVTFEDEIEINVSAEDISLIFSESPNSEDVVLDGISRFHVFMKSVSEDTLNKLCKEHRAITRKFFLEQAKRFKDDNANCKM